jgi:hypothetical protein
METNTMQEVCFCGWIGRPLDRQLIFVEHDGGGTLSAACPQCGRTDDLTWLHPAERQMMVRRATAGMLHAAGARQVARIPVASLADDARLVGVS